MTIPKPKFRKLNEDTYEVTFRGAVIGEVSRGWWALGRAGWGHDEDCRFGYKSRQEAAAKLLAHHQGRTSLRRVPNPPYTRRRCPR